MERTALRDRVVDGAAVSCWSESAPDPGAGIGALAGFERTERSSMKQAAKASLLQAGVVVTSFDATVPVIDRAITDGLG